MSNVYKLPSAERRYDEASLWIAKLDKGLSSKEREALKLWLSESAENKELFLKMAEVWDKTEVLSRLADLFPQPARHRHLSAVWAPAIAASIALFVFSIFFLGVGPDPHSDQSEFAGIVNNQGLYQTALGEQTTVNLPDDTQVVLNTNTLLRVHYTQNHRFLILERGEIHVDVAHDEQRPLSVVAGQRIIQAVGTAFNIELHNDQRVELVVTEGKVLVGVHDRGSSKGDIPGPQLSKDESTLVSEGHQMLMAEDDAQAELIEPDEIEVKLSWRQGNLIFRGESLEEAVAEISRYTSVEFVFIQENLKTVRVSGFFKAGDVDGLLAALRDNFDIAYQREEEKILLGGVQ